LLGIGPDWAGVPQSIRTVTEKLGQEIPGDEVAKKRPDSARSTLLPLKKRGYAAIIEMPPSKGKTLRPKSDTRNPTEEGKIEGLTNVKDLLKGGHDFTDGTLFQGKRSGGTAVKKSASLLEDLVDTKEKRKEIRIKTTIGVGARRFRPGERYHIDITNS